MGSCMVDCVLFKKEKNGFTKIGRIELSGKTWQDVRRLGYCFVTARGRFSRVPGIAKYCAVHGDIADDGFKSVRGVYME